MVKEDWQSFEMEICLSRGRGKREGKYYQINHVKKFESYFSKVPKKLEALPLSHLMSFILLPRLLVVLTKLAILPS